MKKIRFLLTPIFICTIIFGVVPADAKVHSATVTIDATSREAWTFFSFSTGKPVEVEHHSSSINWDLGFQRTMVIVNGGASGPGEGTVLILEGVQFEDVVAAPEGVYVPDTDQIATIARGDGWYTYTGPPNHLVLPNDRVYVLQTAAGLFAKLRFIGYYSDNEAKEGSGNITIEYAFQDDGSRSFQTSAQTSVEAKAKLVTTWARLKFGS